ncbi:MAG TPA: LysM peptidoglycan-binding domain-containing protein [Verrucomicrobiae bacterium]
MKFFEGKFRCGKINTINPPRRKDANSAKPMTNPNPFIPQGSLEHNKRRSRLKLGVFCVLALGVAGLTAMLIQGCKREQSDQTDNTPPPDTNEMAMDTNSSPMADTNSPVTPPVETNPPAVVAPPVENTGTEYVVIKGDSFAKIAKKFGVRVKAIEDANPGIVPTKLKVGQKLSIPAPTSASAASPMSNTDSTGSGNDMYVVKSGDTLTRIARSHGTTVKAIESENNLSTTRITVGEKLKLPLKSDMTTPPAPMENAPAPTSATPTSP